MTWGVELRGDSAAMLRFEKFPEAARQRILDAMDNIGARLKSAIIAGEPNKTGALRGMTDYRIYSDPNRVKLSVGIKTGDAEAARKAAALEYGASQSVEVRAHQMLLDHFWARMVDPRAVSVPAHGRRPNIAEHRFLRDALDEMRAPALTQLQQAIDQAAKESGA